MVCLRNSWRSLKCEDNAILLVVDRLTVLKLSSLLKLSRTPWCPSQLETQHFCSDIPASAGGEQGRRSKPYLSGSSPFGDFLKTEIFFCLFQRSLENSQQPFWCVVPFGVTKYGVSLLEVASVSADEQIKL